VREEALGEDHPDCIATRHNIAELYIAKVMPDKAQEYLQKNIAIMEQRAEKDKQMADIKKDDESEKQKEGSYF
jgi:hypothetical protein